MLIVTLNLINLHVARQAAGQHSVPLYLAFPVNKVV